MKLHTILSYYDESPVWLAATVASLSQIGVQHLLAVDGRYPCFSPGSPACSTIEQSEAIVATAMASGMGVTLVVPHRNEPLAETEKRERSFRLLTELATPMEDWFLVIDADEIVEIGTRDVRDELKALSAPFHAAACRVSSVTDPHAEPGPDNGVNNKTEEIHQKLPVTPRFASRQSRFWRVMHDMRCAPAHYDYTGVDDDGKRWHLRGDIGSFGKEARGFECASIGRVEACEILHRKNHRIYTRRSLKLAYYDLRDKLGIEDAPLVAT